MRRKKVGRNPGARTSRRAAAAELAGRVAPGSQASEKKRRGVWVIRTRDDFYRESRPAPPTPRLPIPFGISRAAYEGAATGQPVTFTCDGHTWNVPAEEARAFGDWIDGEQNRLAFEAVRRTRGRGRPAIDWWGFLNRLVPALEGGERLDDVVARLSKRYEFQSPLEAHRRIKLQRQASTKRLRELDGRRLTGNVPDHERAFHETIKRVLLPRRPGRRPGQSGE